MGTTLESIPPDDSPLQPLSYTMLPPGGRRPWAPSEILSWAIIMLLAIAGAVAAILTQNQIAASTASDLGLPAVSRYATAVRALSRSVPSSAIATTEQQLLDKLDATAKSPETLLILIFLACIWAPVTEELMFRGALFAHLRERFGWLASTLPLSLLFAMIHPQGWIAIHTLTAIAFVLASIREWRGSIVASMAAHSLNNSIVMILVLLIAV